MEVKLRVAIGFGAIISRQCILPVWIAVADGVEVRLVVDVCGRGGGRVLPVLPVLGVVPVTSALILALTPRHWVGVVVAVAQGGGGPVVVVPSSHRGRRGGRRRLVRVAAGRGGRGAAT